MRALRPASSNDGLQVAETRRRPQLVGPRRYVLFDVENPTLGAKSTQAELGELWRMISGDALGITERDHVVVGAARSVVRRYRSVIQGPNVKWVVGADAPEAADSALLAAIDLRRVARDFDEVVIISGDHAFAPLARQAKALGLQVQVVTADHPDRRSMLSSELAATADACILVPRPTIQPLASEAALARRVAGKSRRDRAQVIAA